MVRIRSTDFQRKTGFAVVLAAAVGAITVVLQSRGVKPDIAVMKDVPGKLWIFGYLLMVAGCAVVAWSSNWRKPASTLVLSYLTSGLVAMKAIGFTSDLMWLAASFHIFMAMQIMVWLLLFRLAWWAWGN